MSKSDEQVSFVILKGTRGTQTVETVNGRSIFTGLSVQLTMSWASPSRTSPRIEESRRGT
jgi:hypothetical protein